MLPDLLAANLKLVVCGTAAGTASAKAGHYYAGRGNKFWKTLQSVGLTPTVLAPSEYQQLRKYGIGLTDVIKDQAGADQILSFNKWGPARLRSSIERFQPRVLCFNGKRAAKVYFSTRTVDYGLHVERIGVTRLFVAPSTSGAASGSWDLQKWKELAALAGVLSA